MSQPTGGLVLNPSQQIQLLGSPRGGQGAATTTKGIIDTIKLSVYSRGKKSILYHKQMYGTSPDNDNNDKSDFVLKSWVGRFY